MARNIFQQTIVPEKPRALADERVYVYVPKATNDDKGIASFEDRDFNVKEGNVSLIWPIKMEVEELSNPLENISRIKVLEDEFETTGNEASVMNPKNGLTYKSATAEVKLKRTKRNAFTKPDLVQLSNHDFDATEDSNGFVKYTIKKNNPFFEPSLVHLSDSDFEKDSNEVVKVKWPIASDSKYGLVKISPNSDGYLKFAGNGDLSVDIDTVKKYIVSKLTKGDFGLDKVENRAFDSYIYDDFGNSMKSHFEEKFSEKVNVDTWNSLFLDWNPPSDDLRTPQLRFDALTEKDRALQNEIEAVRSTESFLGYFSSSSELSKYPANEHYGHYAFIMETSTYWAVEMDDGVYTWVDTKQKTLGHPDLLETDSSVIQPNGIASIGSSMKWLSSDHVHPVDTTRLGVDIYKSTDIKIKTERSTGSDFKFSLWEDKNGVYEPNREVNVPYVRQSQLLHNWAGNHEFVDDERYEDRYWAGSVEDFENEKSYGKSTIFFVEDEEEYTEENFVTYKLLVDAGLRILEGDQREAIVTVNKSDAENLVGKTLTLRLGSHVDFNTGKEFTYYQLEPIIEDAYAANKLIVSTGTGNLDTLNIRANSILATNKNGGESILEKGRLLLSGDENAVETFDTEDIEGRLLVSDGLGGVKLSNFIKAGNVLVTGENGVLDDTKINADNYLVTDISEDVTILEAGQLLISKTGNRITTLPMSNISNRPIVTDGEGGIKEAKFSAYKLLYTDENGSLVPFPMTLADTGKAIGVDSKGEPTLLTLTHPNKLPVDFLTTEPNEDNQNGIKLVILNTKPTNFYNGYIYLY